MYIYILCLYTKSAGNINGAACIGSRSDLRAGLGFTIYISG